MTTQAQYASIPKLGKVTIAVANALRDGTGAMGTLLTASPTIMSGTRVDKIQVQAVGDTLPGIVRLFLVKGSPGTPISSIAFSSTTATVTTASSHGLATGDLATVQNAMPDQYNVTNAAITVPNATTFTYTLPVAPTTNAIAQGAFSTIKAAEIAQLWREIPVTAATVVPRTITSITSTTALATLTTAAPHGLTTGDTVIVSGATPAAYNGSYVITVTGPSTFTYTMASSPGANASITGAYSVIKSAFSKAMASQFASDAGYLPLILPAGWQLRASTNNADAFSVSTTFVGDMQ